MQHVSQTSCRIQPTSPEVFPVKCAICIRRSANGPWVWHLRLRLHWRWMRKAQVVCEKSPEDHQRLFSLLPSGRRFGSIRSCTSPLFPLAIKLLNIQNWKAFTQHTHTISYVMYCTLSGCWTPRPDISVMAGPIRHTNYSLYLMNNLADPLSPTTMTIPRKLHSFRS